MTKNNIWEYGQTSVEKALNDLEIPDSWQFRKGGQFDTVLEINAPKPESWNKPPKPGIDLVFTRSDFQSILTNIPDMSTHYADTSSYQEAIDTCQKAIEDMKNLGY